VKGASEGIYTTYNIRIRYMIQYYSLIMEKV